MAFPTRRFTAKPILEKARSFGMAYTSRTPDSRRSFPLWTLVNAFFPRRRRSRLNPKELFVEVGFTFNPAPVRAGIHASAVFE